MVRVIELVEYLGDHASQLDGSLEYDDDFEVFAVQLIGRQIPQRTGRVDAVHDGHRPRQEDVAIVVSRLRLEGQRKLTERDKFSFGRQLVAYHQRSDRGVDEMRPRPHVADPEHQFVLAVSAADDGVSAEHERLAAAFGSRDFREEQSGDKYSDESAQVDLHHDDEDARAARGVDHSRPVADRRVGLERVQHGRPNVEDLVYTRSRVGVVAVVSVAMHVRYSQVDRGKRQPADDERS